jgi:aquaporin Z
MPKLLTELIGTFFLVFTIGMTASSQTPLAAIAIGSSLMIMVYMGGHISGAHYNPAVTLAVFLRGKLTSKEVVPYWVAQLAGAILATVAVRLITGSSFAPAPAPSASVLPALLTEILYTFALALVVLNVATAPATAGNSYYGLAIGFTITVGAIAGGPVSGGAFNPAVGIGPTLVHGLMGGGSFEALWLYIVGPLLGGALAAYVFKAQGAAGTTP